MKMKDRKGPPSSKVQDLTFSAAAFITFDPVATDPVKATLSRWAC